MTDTLGTTTNVTLTINGRSITAAKGELIIAVAEKTGTYIPRFCYHPRMSSVAFCRMCLVEVEGPRGSTLQPSCFVSVAEGMVVNTESEKVKKAQDGVLEFLLANHPLDCPVCDKGGECPLQDQTLAHGSGETRFIEEKRHFAKPIEIGELVLLDRERCIQCARCTRFASDVAGEAQIDFVGRGDDIEVAPFPTEPFDSIFSGNTVQICPVGALTAKPYRFSARPWDLEQVESTCTTCAVGCREAVQSAGGRLTRVLGIDSDPVNHGWLCDKGRFAIEAVQSDAGTGDVSDPATRITEPLVREGERFVAVSWGEALARARDIVRVPGDQVGAIGGASLTNEGSFAWEKFLRDVIGTENIDAQFDDGLDASLLLELPRASIDEAANARVVVTLSGDLREELPILFLRLRSSLVAGTSTLVEFATGPSALHSLAAISLLTRPGEAHLVARALGGDSAAVASLASHPHGSAISTEQWDGAREVLGATGEGVVFVVGRPNLAESSQVIESAIQSLARSFPDATFLPALRRSNVMGALDMGLAPGLRPGRTTGATGRSTVEQLRALASGEQSSLVLLGGELLDNVADVALARSALETARVVAVTGNGGSTLAFADVILPVAIQHERWGTVTNIEGRVSAVTPKVVPPGSAWTDVAIAAELAEECGQSLGLSSPEETSSIIEEEIGYPAASVLAAAPSDGVIVGRQNQHFTRALLDPMANPGIRSADEVGLAPWAGSVVPPRSNEHLRAQRESEREVGEIENRNEDWIKVIERSNERDEFEVPSSSLPDQYSMSLIVSRRLYDRGSAVLATPALVPLVPTTQALVHPLDLDRLGLSSDDRAVVSNARGAFEVRVRASTQVPRGCVQMAFATLTDQGVDAVGSLVDASVVVGVVRLATL